MKTPISTFFWALLALGPSLIVAHGAQAAGTATVNDMPQQDQTFVQAASMSDSTEIDASKLAAKQSQDKDVRSFAHHMIMDHTKLSAQLKMAMPHGATVPKDDADTTVLDSLKGLKGHAFDKAYIQQVGLDGHKKAVDAFQQEADGGQSAELKKAAQKALPTIKQHYEMAQKLATKKGIAAP